MVSLGMDWFQLFSASFPVYLKEHKISYEKEFKDKEWSELIFKFLEEMAKTMNFHVTKEESTIKSQRFDMVWRSSDNPPLKIFIEHENQDVEVAINDEVIKLSDYKADLHVCISYIHSDEYPGINYVSKVKTKLEEGGYTDEFLLVLGSMPLNSPTDWVCHRFFQKLQLYNELLFFPSSVKLIPYLGEDEKIENEEPEDWMLNRLKIWKRIQQRGGSVTREELHEIAKDVGMDNRGLGGFFAGKDSSLYWKRDRVKLREWVEEYIKKYNNYID